MLSRPIVATDRRGGSGLGCALATTAAFGGAFFTGAGFGFSVSARGGSGTGFGSSFFSSGGGGFNRSLAISIGFSVGASGAGGAKSSA